jgi:hypothetical protein
MPLSPARRTERGQIRQKEMQVRVGDKVRLRADVKDNVLHIEMA